MDPTDYGPNPYVVDIRDLTSANELFRATKWTGKHLQMTVMAIPIGGEVGLERHDDIDQFIRIEEGDAVVMMGPSPEALDQTWEADDDFAIFVPAGTWHNLINVGDEPLKLYSIYAEPAHEHGTVHETAEDAVHEHEG